MSDSPGRRNSNPSPKTEEGRRGSGPPSSNGSASDRVNSFFRHDSKPTPNPYSRKSSSQSNAPSIKYSHRRYASNSSGISATGPPPLGPRKRSIFNMKEHQPDSMEFYSPPFTIEEDSSSELKIVQFAMNQSKKEELAIFHKKCSKYTLRFHNKEQEEEFWVYFGITTEGTTRASIGLGAIVLFCSFIIQVVSYLDPSNIARERKLAPAIIALIASLFLAFLVGLTYTKTYIKHKLVNLTTSAMLILLITSAILNYALVVPFLLDLTDGTSLGFYHPYGYVVLLMAWAGMAVYARVRFLIVIFDILYALALTAGVWGSFDIRIWLLSIAIYFIIACAFVFLILLIGCYYREREIRMEFVKFQDMYVKNIQLEAQVAALRLQTNTNVVNGDDHDLASPIEKISFMLAEVAKDSALGYRNAKFLREVIELITTNQLFTPNVVQQIAGGKLHVTGEAQSWLLNEVQKKAAPRTQPAGSNARNPSIFADDLLLSIEKPALKDLFMKTNTLNFPIFELNEKTSTPLRHLVLHLLQSHDIIESLQLDMGKLRRMLTRIEQGYRKDITYHTSLHAADVAQTANFLMSTPQLLEKLNSVEKLSVIIAAAIHDFNHPGVSNNFLVKARHPLALLYNDQAVLENHHLAAAFEVLYDKDCNIFTALTPEQQTSSRQLIIDLVLATDFSRHFTLISNFNAKANLGTFDLTKSEDITLLLQMCIKCSDVSNPGKPYELYSRWADRVMEEFYCQGDLERARGLPISPFMDREKPNMVDCQVNFIKFICAPLFESLGNQLEVFELVENSRENMRILRELDKKDLLHLGAEPNLAGKPPLKSNKSLNMKLVDFRYRPGIDDEIFNEKAKAKNRKVSAATLTDLPSLSSESLMLDDGVRKSMSNPNFSHPDMVDGNDQPPVRTKSTPGKSPGPRRRKSKQSTGTDEIPLEPIPKKSISKGNKRRFRSNTASPSVSVPSTPTLKKPETPRPVFMAEEDPPADHTT